MVARTRVASAAHHRRDAAQIGSRISVLRDPQGFPDRGTGFINLRTGLGGHLLPRMSRTAQVDLHHSVEPSRCIATARSDLVAADGGEHGRVSSSSSRAISVSVMTSSGAGRQVVPHASMCLLQPVQNLNLGVRSPRALYQYTRRPATSTSLSLPCRAGDARPPYSADVGSVCRSRARRRSSTSIVERRGARLTAEQIHHTL